jgi:hypothetical protein
MTSEVLFDVNRTIEWLVFQREVSSTGLLIDGTAGYKASQKVPNYASNLHALRPVIERFENHGATITTAKASDGWTCTFEPSPDATDSWYAATVTDRSEPVAICLCILKAARDVLRLRDRMLPRVAELLGQTDELVNP